MLDRARQILQDTFGYPDFRPGQDEIIATVLEGRDALVLMPTGGGKSLCYQIPALVREGTAVVVSPLIALMQDQVNALAQLGVKAAFLNSTLDMRTTQAVEHQFLDGELDLLYVAPERLVGERTQSLLSRGHLALFAIDEAHCVSQWGHDFRADYLQLSLLHERFPQVPRIALTATADERTREEILDRLDLRSGALFVHGFDRPNIRYRISQKQSARKQLAAFLKDEHEGHAGIVYCLSRKRVEETAEWLVGQGYDAYAYHAGLPAEERQENQERFLREDGVIIVATIAFGMGIDKPDVRFVAHMDLPSSMEAYYQETGRAGRDGLPADAWMVYGLQDVVLRRQMLEQSEADENHKRLERQRLDALLALCETTECRRRVLLKYFGESHDPCGNCDTCLDPVDSYDGTVVAQKALSCVFRTGGRFGVAHLTEVLLGKSSERIERLGHDQVSTFGIGAELSGQEWRGVYRQLVASGLVKTDNEGYGTLQLTPAATPVLRGEASVFLRKDTAPKKKARKVKVQDGTVRRRGDVDFSNNEDQQLFEALRKCRGWLAKKQGVPPYLIFNNASLVEMVERKPTTLDEFLEISGVGQSKAKRYGEAFMKAIREV